MAGKETKTVDSVIDTLTKFRRWCSGRGRKYIEGQMPVDATAVCEALTVALNSMKHRLSHGDFRAIARLAERPKNTLKPTEVAALKNARRIVRYLDKVDSE